MSQADFVARLVARLAELGVRRAVLSPGYRNAPLALALERRAEIETTVIVDERSAGFVALGLARASEEPVALCCTSGTALAHYMPAVVEARRAGTPLVLLTANRPDELQRCGAPQTIEQGGFFGDQVVYHDRIEQPAGRDADLPAGADPLAARLALALHAAAGTPPGGPVHLDIPLRKPLVEQAEPEAQTAAGRPLIGGARLSADEAFVERCVEALAACERLLLVAGPDLGPGAEARGVALGELAAAAGLPLCGDALAPARRQAGAIVHADLYLRDPTIRCALAAAGVLWCGAAPTSKHLAALINEVSGPVIRCDAGGRPLDPSLRADLVLPADPLPLLAALAEARGPAAAGPSPDGAWLGAWRRADHAAAGALDGCCAAGRWWEAGAVRQACAATSAERIFVGSSMAVRDLDGHATPRAEQRIFGNRGANGIDGALATAWGIAASGGPTLAIVGDVTFAHDVGSLLAAARQPALDLTVLVLDNRGGRIFGHVDVGQVAEYERLFLTPTGLAFGEIARAAGARHLVVDGGAELVAALDAARGPGVTVIEASFEPSAADATRREVLAGVHAAVAGALGLGQ